MYVCVLHGIVRTVIYGMYSLPLVYVLHFNGNVGLAH